MSSYLSFACKQLIMLVLLRRITYVKISSISAKLRKFFSAYTSFIDQHDRVMQCMNHISDIYGTCSRTVQAVMVQQLCKYDHTLAR